MALYVGDSRDVLRNVADASVDAVVCDPPYELGFMGRKWDASGIAYDVDLWREVLRVMKPGAHLLAFGGTRTYHRMTCAIEDAGFEIRDCIAWIYGQGFPKSLDVSKAIDKAAGAERKVVGSYTVGGTAAKGRHKGRATCAADEGTAKGATLELAITAPATNDAKRWQGWGTALKPAHEPVVVARKPLEGTVTSNVITHGTGGINVDACRVAYTQETELGDLRMAGRWPANVALDEDAAQELDAQSGDRVSGSRSAGVRKGLGFHGANGDGGPAIEGSRGGASRFFYTAKASTHEREQGLAHRAKRKVNDGREATADSPRLRAETMRGNTHPTVKPIDLMRWLCRLVTPPNGLILDPFAGSGSTLIAAHAEGFRAVGIELDEEHASIARDRLGGHASLFVGLR